ncbi:hypothetical protein T01_12198 [Trichinella spiralis]|uniref:Uncharacterized protein n=1 Tax=Trichinella spiralis TaxID=6334 RepID=A0A0V1B1W9_TRISP|nr:hypothetical protein T01_12198 [Trichinella spiralis]
MRYSSHSSGSFSATWPDNGKWTAHLGNILTITGAIFDWLIKKRYLISAKLGFNKILSAESSHIACLAFSTPLRLSPEN